MAIPKNAKPAKSKKTQPEVAEQKTDFKAKNVFTKQKFSSLNVNLTERQMELYKTIRNNIFTIVQGPSGTAKTYTACYTALGLLADAKIEQIIITKPLVEANDRSMGFLPGTLEDKIYPYMKSYLHTFEKILTKPVLDILISNKVIVIETLNFMRGDTFDRSIMLLDECQNATMTDLILWITRLGKDSKAVMLGDVSQYDIDRRDAKFMDFVDILDGIHDIAKFSFGQDDIVRNELLKAIIDRYEKHKYKKKD